MSDRSRIEQRDEILAGLGMLVQPLSKLLERLPAKQAECSYVDAQYQAELAKFVEILRAYSKYGEFFFDTEFSNARRVLQSLTADLHHCPTATATNIPWIRKAFLDRLAAAQAAIRSIPCDEKGEVLPEAAPFSAYLKLCAIFANATARLDIFDPYLHADVFHRYLFELPPAVMVQVITSPKVMAGSDTVRRDRIVAVSELIARERKDNYRFLVTAQQHDRHFRADDTILHGGGSITHAGMFAPYTLSQLDPSQSNHAFLDAVIAGAEEWYGPNAPTHRRQ